jgi:UDP-N-acetylmuramoyl-L-alanyl-D-glutamate--2,6-diaminopimelate ligase
LRLRTLIAEDGRIIGNGEVEITGLACDSRCVSTGDLFVALPGTRADGRAYLDEALKRGAGALLVPEGTATAGFAVPVAIAADPRRTLARIAARFSGAQPEVTVAVTGTNGKSSIVSFARQLWTGLGHAAASVGTLGVETASTSVPLALTTPDPIALHRVLAELARGGVDHAAIEASSHALAQRRVDGVRLAAAAFSNLTRDHFDYHGSEAAYLAAKASLFSEVLPEGAAAVLNADVPEYAALAAIARDRRLDLVDYGRKARRLRLVGREPLPDGQRLHLVLDGQEVRFASPLVGGFQAHNLLAAIGLVLATGASLEALLPLLPQVVGARGRMQLVSRLPNGAAVFVDYAHTPDALERVLEALREHCSGRLGVVFGAGGDRDPGKRPLMGAAAARLADRVWVTDDNPRSEEPAAIRAAVLSGCPGGIDAGDRAGAIATAVRALGPGDVLVVAGKGHETGQTIGGTTHPFDDAEVVREAAALAGGVAA